MALNEQQQRAVNHKNGPCMIISVPGSGKTRIIVERMVKLIDDGIDPSSILCITFTNKAANEMKSRIIKRLNSEKITSHICTFHALCATLIRKYGERVNYPKNFTIIQQDEQQDLIKKIIRSFGKDPKEDHINIYSIAEAVNNGRESLNIDGVIDEKFDNNNFVKKICYEYLKDIKEQNILDFSGLLYEAYNILKDNKDILELLQSKWQYIQVDEFQDTNLIQFKIVEMLGEKHKNMFMVGDISQTIYSWRGSRYQNILDFLNNNKNTIQIPLDMNYRSTPEILKTASTLIKKNKSHMLGDIKTENSSGTNVICKNFYNSNEEAEWVANQIKYIVKNEGYEYKDIAIFYRVNAISMDFQTTLTNFSIPFTIIGGPSFFDRKEIKDCLSMLKFVANPKDNTAFHRVASLLPGVGDKTIGVIENLAKEKQKSLLEVCKNIDDFSPKNTIKKAASKIKEIYSENYEEMTIGKCLDTLVDKFKYKDYLFASNMDNVPDRLNNINEFMTNVAAFGEDGGTLEKYLQNITLVTSSDKENDANAVVLQTLHSSKGLEYPVVFIVRAEQNMLPHQMAIMEAKKEEIAEKIEEERRLLYVGMTRSKKKLTISFCRNVKVRDRYGGVQYKPTSPSQFLFEAELIKERNSDKI